jgi:endogenous inhibitor of DNA gyrase (YacG/DUF329 family)
MKTCNNCQKALDPNGKYYKYQVWCSNKCYKTNAARNKRQKARQQKHAFSQCKLCQKPLEQNPNGRPKSYCNLEHRRRFELLIGRQRHAEVQNKTCPQCQQDFQAGALDSKRKFCSKGCRESSYKLDPTILLNCRYCNLVFERENIKGKRPAGCMTCRTSGPGRRYQGYRKHKDFIFKRDSGICQICLVAVNFDAYYLERFAATLDHIIPKALNGSHEPENLQLAHRWCNSVKQDKYQPHG